MTDYHDKYLPTLRSIDDGSRIILLSMHEPKYCGNSCMSFQNWGLLSSDFPSVPQILCLLLVMQLRLLIDEMQMTCRERKDLDSVSSCQLFQCNHGMTLLVDLESETSSKAPKSTCHESALDILNTDTDYEVKWSKTVNLQTTLAHFGYGVSYIEIRRNKLTTDRTPHRDKASSRHMAGQSCPASVAVLSMIGGYRAAYCISCIFQHWLRTAI